MPVNNPLELKEKIMSFMKLKGPSLPVHIAKEVGLNTLFTSAFLSELISDKRIKISKMKVGGSPLYFLPGQEFRLENFANFLNNKEKEAFNLLKEKKFLKDSKQEPAIRVALREIRDFAIPFKKNDLIYWRFLTVPESEFMEKEEITVPPTAIKKSISILTTEETSEQSEPISKEKTLDIFEKKKEFKPKEKKKSLKKQSKKSSKKQEETFFNKIKETLNRKSIEIIDIIGISNSEIILKVKEEKEYILFALNKKKINEKDIIKAHKKAKEYELEFKIFFLGDVPKKIEDFIISAKNLQSIEKIE